MNFHAILLRELTMAARRPSMFVIRAVMAGIAGLIAVAIIVLTVRGVIPPEDAGRNLLWALGAAGMIWALFEGILLTSDSISCERRDGTLGLLFLSDLSARDIVAGKLGAAGLRTLFALLAASPAPALTFIFGGVTLGEYAQLILALLNALFFALCLGTFISCHASERRRAQVRAAATLLWFLFVAPTLAIYLYQHGSIASALLFAAGPVTPFLVIVAQDANLSGAFAASFAISNFLAWSLFALASRQLAANWRDLPLTLDSSIAPRRASRLADGNPVFWLALRRAKGLPLFTVFYTLVAGLAVALGITVPGERYAIALGLSLLCLHGALSIEVSAIASRSLADARRSGVLELLLTTPLREDEIAAGHLLALKRHITKAFLFLLALGVLLFSFLWHYATPGQFTGYLIAYAILVPAHLGELWFNARVGLWNGLFTGNPNRAARMTTGAVIGASVPAIFVATFTVFFLQPVLGGDAAGIAAAIAFIFVVCGVLAAWFALAHSRLADSMREVAATPIGLKPSA